MKIKFINWLWLSICITSIITLISPLEFANISSKIFFYSFSFFWFIIIYLQEIFNYYKKFNLITFMIFCLLNLIFYIYDFFCFGSKYQTQTIIFTEIENPKNKIIEEWQDLGTFGFNKRIQKIKYFTPIFYWKSSFDTSKLDKSKWKLINEKVNELNLKGEF